MIVFAHNLLDIHQKKGTFFVKIGCNPLWISKIVVPLHRQKETMTSSIEVTQTHYTEVLVKVIEKIDLGLVRVNS